MSMAASSHPHGSRVKHCPNEQRSEASIDGMLVPGQEKALIFIVFLVLWDGSCYDEKERKIK